MLLVYLEDGRVEIDNNPVENAIRPTAIGKKNCLRLCCQASHGRCRYRGREVAVHRRSRSRATQRHPDHDHRSVPQSRNRPANLLAGSPRPPADVDQPADCGGDTQSLVQGATKRPSAESGVAVPIKTQLQIRGAWRTAKLLSANEVPKLGQAVGMGKNKTPRVSFEARGDLIWQRPTFAGPIAQLSSAQQRFTSVFGMGTGGTTVPWSPDVAS